MEQTVTVDRRKASGKIRIMNAVNNGPTAPGVRQSPSSQDSVHHRS